MRRFLRGKRKYFVIVVFALLLSLALEVFIPTGFRFDYLEYKDHPEIETQEYKLSDFAPDGCSINGDKVITETTDSFLLLNQPVNMNVTKIKIYFTDPVSNDARFVVYYTNEDNQKFMDSQIFQRFIYKNTQVDVIKADYTYMKNIRIDLGDFSGLEFNIQSIQFEYIDPLSYCKENFSWIRFVFFFLILSLIPLELILINKP